MGIKRRWSREMEGNIFKAAQTSIGNQRRKVRLFKRPLCVVNVRKSQKEKDCEPPKRKKCSTVGAMFEKPWPRMAQCQGM